MAVSIFRATDSELIRASESTYDAAHDAASGTIFSPPAVENTYSATYGTYGVYRSFVYFPTSDLGNISSARYVFSTYRLAEADSGHATLHLVEGIQSIPVVATDFGAHLSKITSGGSIAYANLGQHPTDSGQNTIILNATGLSWIASTTKFCLRLAGDINNSTPTGSNYIYFVEGGGWTGVTTNAATDVTNSTAKLNGQANCGKQAPPYLEITHDGTNPTYPRVRFQYGTTDSYGTDTTWQSGISLFSSFTANINSLTSGTTFHYRAQLEDAGGVENGDDVEFTTSPTPGYIWTEGNMLHFTSDIREQRMLGLDTVTNATAGHLFVEGNWLHYVSENGDERRLKGYRRIGSGTAGHIYVDDMWIHYTDSSGIKRELGTWILGGSHLGVGTILHA